MPGLGRPSATFSGGGSKTRTPGWLGTKAMDVQAQLPPMCAPSTGRSCCHGWMELCPPMHSEHRVPPTYHVKHQVPIPTVSVSANCLDHLNTFLHKLDTAIPFAVPSHLLYKQMWEREGERVVPGIRTSVPFLGTFPNPFFIQKRVLRYATQ